MPRFCRVLFGPRVTVRPQVISGATSPGQQVCIGRRARSTSAPSHTISWHGADERSFGAMLQHLHEDAAACSATRPSGPSAARAPSGRRAACRFRAAPRPTPRPCPARRARRAEQVAEHRHRDGPSASRTAAPDRPRFSTRSQISVISRRGSTSTAMRFSSPGVRAARGSRGGRRISWRRCYQTGAALLFERFQCDRPSTGSRQARLLCESR